MRTLFKSTSIFHLQTEVSPKPMVWLRHNYFRTALYDNIQALTDPNVKYN